MKSTASFLLVILLLAYALAGAMDGVEGPKNCNQCGMDRAAYARSRMLVVYADGTTVGVCSLHCAAEELQRNRDKLVNAVMVADYITHELIDARTAVWVVGGRPAGVMTAVPKWAFAGKEAAREFIEKNGGIVNSFDLALKLATTEVLEQAAEEKAVEREMLRELR